MSWIIVVLVGAVVNAFTYVCLCVWLGAVLVFHLFYLFPLFFSTFVVVFLARSFFQQSELFRKNFSFFLKIVVVSRLVSLSLRVRHQSFSFVLCAALYGALSMYLDMHWILCDYETPIILPCNTMLVHGEKTTIQLAYIEFGFSMLPSLR